MKVVRMDLADAAKLVRDGDLITTGGATFNRAPMEMIRELIRQGRKGLSLVDREPSIDFDMLIGAECVEKVRAGMLAFEIFGMAPNFRRKAEARQLIVKEGACQPIIAGLRAAAMGIPSLPVKGMAGSDVLEITEVIGGYKQIEDPFTGEKLIAVRAIEPHVAIIHAQKGDQYGNVRIEGPVYEDVIKAKAAQRVVVTVEEMVPTEEFRRHPELTTLPHFLVDAVVEAPSGASPTSCFNYYDADYDHVREYIRYAQEDRFIEYLDRYVFGGVSA
ncbi:MAG: CoA transferase subunit A [Candidatus Methylomirabilia bacterium]